MENILLNEQIKKMMLLSQYDTSKTLSENHILLEQGNVVKTVAKDVKIAGKTLPKVEAEAIMSRIAKNPTKYPGLNTIDDVIKGVKQGNTFAVQAVLKTTKNPDILKSLATKLVADANVMGKLASNAKNNKKSVETYLKQLGYSDEAINALKAADKSGKYFKLPKGGKVSTNIPKKKTTRPKNKQSTFKNWIKKFGKGWSSMSRTQKVLAIAASGLGIYLLWRYFKDEEPGVYSDCVLSYMSDEDLTKMASLGFGEGIIISDVPNRQLKAMGGVKLFTDGTLKSVTGNIEGTWESDGTSINVTIGGQTFSIPCGSNEIEGEDENDGETGESKWKFCPNPPFELYCKNDLIKKVQGCLGVKVDGYLGPITQTALGNAGVGLPLTQEGIDKVCKISQSGPPPKPEVQTPEQQFGTSGNINLVGGTGGQSGAQEIEVNINDV